MTVTATTQCRPDEIADAIVALVRESFGQQPTHEVLDGIWLAFQRMYGPLEASQALRAYLSVFDR